MGRAPCCDKANVKRGPWSPEEDDILKNYVQNHGNGGNWIALPRRAGLNRCGKSCRLRWLNYLRPGIKHGDYTEEEDDMISSLYGSIGSRWSIIASKLPGRTDNDIKNYWNTKLKKKLLSGPKTRPNCHIASHESTIQRSSVLPTSMPCMENAYYGNSAMYTNLNSFTWTSPQELNYEQSFDSQKVIMDTIQEHVFSPLMEISDLGTSGRTNNSSTTSNSSYQDYVSTLSIPSCKDLGSNAPFWTTNVGVGEGKDISMQFCSDMFYDEDDILVNFCSEE